MARIIAPNKQNTQKSSCEPSCPLCNGNGWILSIDDDGYEVAKECECHKRDRINSRLAFADIPDAYKNYRLASFKRNVYVDRASIKEIEQIIIYYMDNLSEMMDEGIGLYLYSKVKGSGKTRMITSISNELIYEHDKRVKFATGLDIISEIKNSWDRNTNGTESQLIRDLTDIEILVIDDFGMEKHSEKTSWIDDKFFQIINTRYMNKKVTMFTSNIELEKLSYDERIISRIKERVYQIHFPEESVRDGIALTRQMKMNNGKV